MNTEKAVDWEQLAISTFREFLIENRELLKFVAHWGDGHGGYLLRVIQRELDVSPKPFLSRSSRKVRIPQSLRTQVFERDAYRCVHCGGHQDLACDHIVPESAGGETAFHNLQTLCRPCNSRKGSKA